MTDTDRADYLQKKMEEIMEIVSAKDGTDEAKKACMRECGDDKADISNLEAVMVRKIFYITKDALEDVQDGHALWIEKSDNAIIKAEKAEKAIEKTKELLESDDRDQQRYGIQREAMLRELDLWPEENHD